MNESLQEPRGIHRRTQFAVTSSLRSRFERMVDRRSGDDECWPWKGAIRNGYGAIKHEKKVLGTHVVAFVLNGGVIGDGELVVHSCDNKLCCNPAHLSSGTASRNVREMYSRRNVNSPRGEEVEHAVLTDSDVRTFLALRAVLGIGYHRASRMLGLSRCALKGVAAGRTWRHVAAPTIDESQAIVRAIGLTA